MKRLALFATGLLAALALPAVALAENMSSSVSDGTAAQDAVSSGVLGTSGDGGGGVSGTLPFTGLNLALIVAVGVALIATGFLLRRRTAKSSS